MFLFQVWISLDVGEGVGFLVDIIALFLLSEGTTIISIVTVTTLKSRQQLSRIPFSLNFFPLVYVFRFIMMAIVCAAK